MNNNNPYIQYIEAHPELQKKFNQIWIERFYQNNRIQEYLVKFYVLKHDDTYIGIVESERPYSATYLLNAVIPLFLLCYNLCCYKALQNLVCRYNNIDLYIYKGSSINKLQSLISTEIIAKKKKRNYSI